MSGTKQQNWQPGALTIPGLAATEPHLGRSFPENALQTEEHLFCNQRKILPLNGQIQQQPPVRGACKEFQQPQEKPGSAQVLLRFCSGSCG